MPRYLDRHARSSEDGWGSEPARSQQRQAAAADDPAKRQPPAKKDPRLCKAAHWKGPHQAEFRVGAYHWRRPGCTWGISWRGVVEWRCNHEEVCSGCNKVLRTSISKQECPDYRPMRDAERTALEAEHEKYLARTASYRRQRRPVITGPTGYRKKRA